MTQYLLEHETMERDAFLTVFGEKTHEQRRTFRLWTPRIKTKVHGRGAMLPWAFSVAKIFSPRCSYFQNFVKVLKIFVSMVRGNR